MSQSPEFKSRHLSLPFIAPAQAQKHVTHNEALRMVDSLLHIHVLSRGTDAPPPAPADGARYIVGNNPTGEWAAEIGAIAAFEDGAWVFYRPAEGWLAWDGDTGEFVGYDGAAWNTISAQPSMSAPQNRLGVNTTADDTNRLAVKSDAVLLSHDDITPGTGDVRLVVNKKAGANTGSIVFQNGFSGRTEMGVSGSDDFAFNVSADGQSWKTAIQIDHQTGQVNLPHTPSSSGLAADAPLVNYFGGSGRFAGVPEPRSVAVQSFEPPNYITPMNGSVFAQGEKFIHNNSSHGGSAGTLDPIMSSLISKLRSPNYRRFGPEFYSLKVTAGTGTAASPIAINGQAHYLTFLSVTAPIFARYTLNYYISVLSGAVVVGGGQETAFDGTAMGTGNAALPAGANDWTQVTLSDDLNTAETLGYHSTLFRLYATAGSIFHLALPSLMVGNITLTPGQNLGLVPSANLWL